MVAGSPSAIAPRTLTSAHFTTTAYAKANLAGIKQFQAAIKTAADWANKNPDQSALILERVAKVSPEVVAASTRANFATTLDPAELQPLIDLAAKYGNFPSFPAGDMIFRG